MPVALILGASRGIGRELARQYAADGWRTLATARRDDDLADLEEQRIEPLKLDVASSNDWAALGWKLDGEKIDVAIYNAGVFGPREGSETPPSDEAFDAVMHTNVLGAMRAIGVVAPLVEAARGRFAFISSAMGSLAGTSSANGWTYRASKAALNAAVHGAACERKATLLILSPGWVKTDMGGASASLDVGTSVRGIRHTIAQFKPEDTGRFLNYDGQPIAW